MKIIYLLLLILSVVLASSINSLTVIEPDSNSKTITSQMTRQVWRIIETQDGLLNDSIIKINDTHLKYIAYFNDTMKSKLLSDYSSGVPVFKQEETQKMCVKYDMTSLKDEKPCLEEKYNLTDVRKVSISGDTFEVVFPLENGMWEFFNESTIIKITNMSLGVFNHTFYDEFFNHIQLGNLFDFESFESGFGNWVDGGTDVERDNSDPASCGTFFVRLDDDTGDNSAMWITLNLSEYTEVNVSFSFAMFASVDENECLYLKCDGNYIDSWGVDSDLSDCNHNLVDDRSWTNQSFTIINSTHCTFDTATNITFESNSSADGEYFMVDCAGISGINSNGTYTGIVQNLTAIAGSEGTIINVTTSTTLPALTNISVQIRTKMLNITDDLLAYYDFDGDDLGNNTCNDIYGDNDGLILSGSVGVIEDGWDSRGYFDDGGDTNNEGCVILASDYNFGNINQFTLYGVFKINDTINTVRGFVNPHEEIRFELVPSLNRMQVRADGLTDANNFYDGHIDQDEWNKVFAFYNGSHLCLEANDNTLDCDASTGTIDVGTSNAGIGSQFGGQFIFNGSIDNVIIWNRSLSKAERDCVRDETCLTNWSAYSDPCDVSINATGCLFNRTNNFTQPRFNFTTGNISVTPLLHNYTYTIQNVTVAADSCTCSGSEDCIVQCSDNCKIISLTDIRPFNLFLKGTGVFTLEADFFVGNITGNYNCGVIFGAGALYPSIT